MVPWFGRVHSDFTWFQMGHETRKTPSHATKKLPGDTTNSGGGSFWFFWILWIWHHPIVGNFFDILRGYLFGYFCDKISLKELFLGHSMTWSNCIASHSTTDLADFLQLGLSENGIALKSSGSSSFSRLIIAHAKPKSKNANYVYIYIGKHFFLDLVTFLLDLATFTGPYYNSFGDGYPSFGPAHPHWFSSQRWPCSSQILGCQPVL